MWEPAPTTDDPTTSASGIEASKPDTFWLSPSGHEFCQNCAVSCETDMVALVGKHAAYCDNCGIRPDNSYKDDIGNPEDYDK